MKKIFSLSLAVVLVLGLSLPGASASAQTTLPFGGLVSYIVPCTCSIPGTVWIWLTPLYYGPKVPLAGPMVFVPGVSKLFAWFMIGVPGSWHLGDYFPGVQSCYIGAPPACTVLPAIGTIRQVGTSKPF